MTDTMIFLTVALIGSGIYITYLHSILSRYRRWSREAQSLLMSFAMKEAMAEYGFDTEPRDDD